MPKYNWTDAHTFQQWEPADLTTITLFNIYRQKKQKWHSESYNGGFTAESYCCVDESVLGWLRALSFAGGNAAAVSQCGTARCDTGARYDSMPALVVIQCRHSMGFDTMLPLDAMPALHGAMPAAARRSVRFKAGRALGANQYWQLI